MSLVIDLDSIRANAPPFDQVAETMEAMHRAVLNDNKKAAEAARKQLSGLLRRLQATADMIGRATMIAGYAELAEALELAWRSTMRGGRWLGVFDGRSA